MKVVGCRGTAELRKDTPFIAITLQLSVFSCNQLEKNKIRKGTSGHVLRLDWKRKPFSNVIININSFRFQEEDKKQQLQIQVQ